MPDKTPITEKRLLAQHLYMNEGKTQREIAMEVSVSERTVYTWIHQYAWDKLKRAAYQAPATISENLCNELIELQNSIAKREQGTRYPTVQEAEVIRKLVGSIERLKKYPSLSQNMQMIETFKNYMRPIDRDFTRQLSNYSERYLTGKSVNGFAPYELEYGIEQVAPVMSFYDEDPELPPVPLQNNAANPTPAPTERERMGQYEKYKQEIGMPCQSGFSGRKEGTGSYFAVDVNGNTTIQKETTPATTSEASNISQPEISQQKTDQSLTGKRNAAASGIPEKPEGTGSKPAN
jgi:transposase-like protein